MTWRWMSASSTRVATWMWLRMPTLTLGNWTRATPIQRPSIDSTTWLFRMLSFRTLVAATTFFGLSGTASLQAGLTAAVALVVAILMGLCAMVVVHYLMRTLYRLSHDGTVKIGDAVGKPATVYLPIPAARAGAGKVQVCMEDRIMEYQAVSSHDDRLPTGTKVVVVDTVGPAMVEVTPEANQWNRDPLYNASQIALSDKS